MTVDHTWVGVGRVQGIKGSGLTERYEVRAEGWRWRWEVGQRAEKREWSEKGRSDQFVQFSQSVRQSVNRPVKKEEGREKGREEKGRERKINNVLPIYSSPVPVRLQP